MTSSEFLGVIACMKRGGPNLVIRALVEPCVPIDDPVERGSARLLASIMLLVVAGFVLLDAYLLATRVGYVPPPVGYPALGASYLLSRCARPRYGAGVATAMFVFVPIEIVGLRGGPPISLSFSSVAPIFAGIFLGGPAILVTGVGSALLVALVPALSRGGASLEIVSTPIVAIGLTTVVMQLHKQHRDWVEATRRRELEHREMQVRHLQKVEAIGRFAGGIAHDFNQMLAIVGGSAEVLRRKGGADSEVEILDSAVKSARELTSQLLSLSRESEAPSGEARPSALFPKIGELLRRVIGGDVEVVLEVDEDLPSVPVSPGKLEQIVLNLATNARDAMPEGGLLELSAKRRDGGVEITVRDTGHGMDEATRTRVFDSFFTTKPEGEGTGLGLAVVSGIVSSARGSIAVDSEPGRGTRVHVWLPEAEHARSRREPVAQRPNTSSMARR